MAISTQNSNVFIQDQSSIHHYRTEIPNIIFEMGLTVYEFSTYCHLKRTAGDRGECWKSSKILCEEIGVSLPKLIEIKRSLSEKGLIKVEKRFHEDGGNATDLITIVDVHTTRVKGWV